MLRHRLKYEEKILHRDFSDASADMVSDLNWRVRDFTFDIGSRVVLELIRYFRNRKSKKSEE